MRIDLRQDVASFDVLPLGEVDPVELAVDPRIYGDGIEGLNGTKASQIHRYIFNIRCCGGDGHRWRHRLRCRSF